jgi:hypothetical protein
VSVTVYASIGNSDDKLSQIAWSGYVEEFIHAITRESEQIFGVWYSESSSPYQNACAAFKLGSHAAAEDLEAILTELRKRYNQDSIAWAEVPETRFI